MQWWHHDLLEVHQRLTLDLVPLYRELGLLCPVLVLVVCIGTPAIPITKIPRKRAKTSMEIHQECHHFDVSDDLRAVLSIPQGLQQCLDAVVILFEVRNKQRILKYLGFFFQMFCEQTQIFPNKTPNVLAKSEGINNLSFRISN